MPIIHSARLSAGALAILGATILVGCGGDNVLSPKFQPEVANSIDNFQFQATGVTGVTQTLTYTWRNTGVQANVNQACSITGGTATLVLRDSTGTQLYSKDLTDNGSFDSAAGAAGSWTIQLTLNRVKGTLNFRVQKKT